MNTDSHSIPGPAPDIEIWFEFASNYSYLA
jgi:hypothetical protein